MVHTRLAAAGVLLLRVLPCPTLMQVASRVLAAEESARFSQAQVEVMRSEFVATSAQLNALQTELAEQKAR